MKKRWKQQVLKRKSFAPTFIITVALWISIFSLFLGADPTNGGVVEIFFVLFFITSTLTASIVLVNSRRGFMIGSALTTILFLQFIGTANFINILIVSLFFTLLELYAMTND